MYSEDYEDEEVEEIQNENFLVSFYRNNKVLVWILLGIILFIILISILTRGGSNSSKSNRTYNVTIDPSGDVVVTIGNSQHLIATVDGDENATVNWSVLDSSIATVDDGTVRAVNYGTTTVVATYKDPNGDEHLGEKTVIVGDGNKDVTLTNVEFKNGDLFMPVGSEYKISLILTPSNAFVGNLTFSSSNDRVVTVDNTGLVRSIDNGEAIISYNVNNGAFTGNLKVYVDSDYSFAEIISTPQSISFDGLLRKIKIGDTSPLTYTITPTDASRSKLLWSSSDTTIASVDETGYVTGISEGACVITVTSVNGVTAKIDVEVEKDIVDVTDITLDVSEINLLVGESEEIFPTISPDDASNKALNYSSSNESVAIVAPNDSGTTAKVYALTSGTATIYVRSNNNIERSIDVTVTGSSSSEENNDDPNWPTYVDPGSSTYIPPSGGSTYYPPSGGSTTTTTPTPRPTNTPRPVTYTCDLSYNRSTNRITITGSASDGTPVKQTEINGRATTYMIPNASGRYTGYVIFENGKRCSKTITVTVPTPTPRPTPITPTIRVTPTSLNIAVGSHQTYQVNSSVTGTFYNTINNSSCIGFYRQDFSRTEINGSYRKINTNYGIPIEGKKACTATVSVRFVPTDRTRYKEVTKVVNVKVTAPTVKLTCTKNIINPGENTTCEAKLSSGDSVKTWLKDGVDQNKKNMTKLILTGQNPGSYKWTVVTTKGASASVIITIKVPQKTTPTIKITPKALNITVGSHQTYQVNSSVTGTFYNTINNSSCIGFYRQDFRITEINGSYRKINTNYGIPIEGKRPCTTTVSVRFVPTDTTKYNVVTQDVTVKVTN